jgi:hypothetical protein
MDLFPVHSPTTGNTAAGGSSASEAAVNVPSNEEMSLPRKRQRQVPFPIIRVRPLRWREKELVQITPLDVTITPVHGEIGEESLSALGSHHGYSEYAPSIPLGDIQRVSRMRVGYLSESSLWTRYTVETARGERQFRVSEREATNVERALRALLGERFASEVSRCLSGIEKCLLTAAAVAGFCLVLTVVSWWFLLLGIILGIFTGLVAWGVRERRNTSSANLPVPPPRRKRGRAGGRRHAKIDRTTSCKRTYA